MTKICIVGYQIKHWLGKMHVYQQRHLDDQQTWLRCLQGDRWWPAMGLCDIQIYIMYDFPKCRLRFRGKPPYIICGSVTGQPYDNKDWRRL
jgi:hypothetical protein